MLDSLAQKVSKRSRQHKFDLFMESMKPTPQTTILDVGVSNSAFGNSHWATENFFENLYPWKKQITAVGLHDFSKFKLAFPEITCVTTDGNGLPFEDNQFDIVFSNAVVEHVGDYRQQRNFIWEACRVGKKVFITTPNFWFPVETHTRLPFVHWLPIGICEQLNERKYHVLKECRLLGPSRFHGLFPASHNVKIVNLGMTLLAISE